MFVLILVWSVVVVVVVSIPCLRWRNCFDLLAKFAYSEKSMLSVGVGNKIIFHQRKRE